jgi:hypothetical protein
MGTQKGKNQNNYEEAESFLSHVPRETLESNTGDEKTNEFGKK